MFVHKEIRYLNTEGLNLYYLTKGCESFNVDLKECLASLRMISNEKEFKSRIPKIYIELSHYRLMVDHNLYHSILSASKNDIMMHMDDKEDPEYKFVK